MAIESNVCALNKILERLCLLRISSFQHLQISIGSEFTNLKVEFPDTQYIASSMTLLMHSVSFAVLALKIELEDGIPVPLGHCSQDYDKGID